MGIRSLSTASISTGTKRSKVWDQSATVPLPSSYESIATYTVGSTAQSSISFSSIPQTYKHLQIRYIARDNAGTAGGDDMFMTFNGGASATYSWHRLNGNGSTAYSGGVTSTSYITISEAGVSRNGNTGGIFSTGIIDIFDYQNANKRKTTRALYGIDVNGSGGVTGLGSGLWEGSTSAITDIAFTIESGRSFIQYSSFALYGIKG